MFKEKNFPSGKYFNFFTDSNLKYTIESPKSIKYDDGEKLNMITSLKIFLQSEIGIQNPNSIIKLNNFEYGPIRNGWNILFIEKEKVWLENVKEHRFSDIIEKLEDFDLALGIFQGQSYPKLSKYNNYPKLSKYNNLRSKV